MELRSITYILSMPVDYFFIYYFGDLSRVELLSLLCCCVAFAVLDNKKSTAGSFCRRHFFSLFSCYVYAAAVNIKYIDP